MLAACLLLNETYINSAQKRIEAAGVLIFTSEAVSGIEIISRMPGIGYGHRISAKSSSSRISGVIIKRAKRKLIARSYARRESIILYPNVLCIAA